jgi:hypothetical protein
MPLPSITLRQATPIRDAKNKKGSSKNIRNKTKKVKSKNIAHKAGSRTSKLSKSFSEANVKRPMTIRKHVKSTRNNGKLSRFNKSNVKRPTTIRKVKRNTDANHDDESIESEDTTEIYRKRIMAEKIISIHGDSIDRETDDEDDNKCDDDDDYDYDYDDYNSSDSESVIDPDFVNHDIDSDLDSDLDSDREHSFVDSDEEIDTVTDEDGNSSDDTDGHKINADDNSIDSHIKKRRDEYFDHAMKNVKIISNMSGGETRQLKADPSYDKLTTIKKNNRFRSYIFSGNGSKNLLRIFMKTTANDPRFGYTRIVQILDHNDYRRFIPINNWRKFWKTYRGEPVRMRRLFEVVLSDMPCKPYLDIEWIVPSTDLEYYGSVKKMDFSEFLSKLIEDIIDIFRGRYSIDLDETEIMIASSHSDDKVSFHVVINKVIDGSTVSFHTNLRTEHGSAWDLCDALIEKDEDLYIDKIDETVYSTDREFRAIFSNKSSEFRPIVPCYSTRIKLDRNSHVEMSVNECLKYIVTYAKNDKYHLINVPTLEEDCLANGKRSMYSSSSSRYGSKSYNSMNSSTYRSSTNSGACSTVYDDIFKFIPQVYDDREINQIIELVRKIHPSACFTNTTHTNGWRFTYKDRSEPCYTGHYHDSNGFYVFRNEVTGRLYMKCMSSNCKETYTLKRGKSTAYTKKFV